ncbi:glycosyltransferase family 2 protein [Campylobacter lari]|nr:glycosyltransferase family 2 protein [Campylobacter lari]
MKTVGVVIPIYNVEKYLKECLDSVINQTYTNLEIILVNDGSTDENSLNIAKEYTLKDKRITLFDKKNGGLSTARNVGIEYFSGEYKLKNKIQTIKENSLIEFNIEGNNPYEIYTVYKSYKAFNNEQDLINFTYPIIDYIIFLDSDDYWELNCIEECVPRMDGVDVVWFDHYFEGDSQNNKSIVEIFSLKKDVVLKSKEIVKLLNECNYKMFHFAWSGMINFNFIFQKKIKFINEFLWEDHLFGISLLIYANFFYLMNTKQYHYRIRQGSICNSVTLYPYITYLEKMFNTPIEARKYYERCSWLIVSRQIIEEILNLKKNNLKQLMIECFFEYYIDRSQQFMFCNKDPLCMYNNMLIYNSRNLVETFKNADKYTLFCFISQNYIKVNKLNYDVVKSNEKLQYYNKQIKNLNTNLDNKNQILNSKISKILSLKQELVEKKNIIENQNSDIKSKNYLLNFYSKHGAAKTRIQNQLSYKLGQAMIINSKSILGYIRMPFVLSYIKDKHKQEQKIYQEKIKKDPSLKLPPLESYPDYKEALKLKNHLSYKLGQALIQANKTWYKGGYVKMWFEIKMIKKENK